VKAIPSGKHPQLPTKDLTDTPGVVPVAPTIGQSSAAPGKPLDGFKTLGQAAFGALAKINKDRKEINDE